MAALAHEYFKRAAQQGYIGAVFELAFQFERGIGTAPTMNRARLLYKVAGRKNHLNASTIWPFCWRPADQPTRNALHLT